MSWKTIPFILVAGLVVLLVIGIQMRKNRQDVLFGSVGYALEQLHRDMTRDSATNPASLPTFTKIEEWRPYLEATPNGRLPGFVTASDVFIAALPENGTNNPSYLVAVRIKDALICGLKSNGVSVRMATAEFENWPHKSLLQP